jgi:hypothetical protein
MNARVRRIVEMGRRALGFSRANPDESAGYAAALARLEELVTGADLLGDQQLNGIRAVRNATAKKVELRRRIKSAHMEHLSKIARIAAREVPELPQKFALPGRGASYLAFRTVARTMAAEAMSRKEVLVTHGLVEKVLDDLNQAIAKFDAAVEQGTEGRRAHVGASAELETVATEIVELVNAMDGLNRYRFAGDAERLAAWESASTVLVRTRATPDVPTAPDTGTPVPTPGEVKPAA